jgi:tetratricopeptide (TPR) repeat protein
MTAVIIIIILIIVLSIGLFFVIKKFSHVNYTEPEIYAEEGSIADFNSISQEPKKTFSDENISNSRMESIRAGFALTLSRIYRFLQSQIQKISRLGEVYHENQREKRKKREQEIQEAIKRDQEALELELTRKASTYEADTSAFEAVTKNIETEIEEKIVGVKEEISPDTKVSNFVEQLLSESDAIIEATSTEDEVSDTYYYEYMEKRYIDRIVVNSRDIEAYKKLGELYVDMKNYPDALEAFTYVVKLKPSDTSANRRIKDLANRLKV